MVSICPVYGVPRSQRVRFRIVMYTCCSPAGRCVGVQCPLPSMRYSPSGDYLAVKALGEPCTADAACGDETAIHCPAGTCTCRPNYALVSGACLPGKALGEACTVNAECTVGRTEA